MKILVLVFALTLTFAAPISAAEPQGASPIEQSQGSDAAGLQSPASSDEINAYLGGDTGVAATPSDRHEEGIVGFLVTLGLIVLALIIFWTLRQSPLRATTRNKTVAPPEVEAPPSAAKKRRKAKRKRP